MPIKYYVVYMVGVGGQYRQFSKGVFEYPVPITEDVLEDALLYIKAQIIIDSPVSEDADLAILSWQQL